LRGLGLYAANGFSSNCGDLSGEGCLKSGRASLDGNALLISTEATILISSDTDGVLLGETL
jgi:hypothetical protein